MSAHYGLLGEALGHSYSPEIHSMLGDYDYRLYECPKDKLDDFLTRREFAGLNVTIPYKKAVIPYCAELSPIAAQLQSVNLLLHREDGTLYGDNTDAYGFCEMVHESKIEVCEKKALVLGSGGASATVCAMLRKMGAGSVTVISRTGENNYQNIDKHADADIIVNATPVGMYPANGKAPLSLRVFQHCSGVFDLIYNPARTALMLEAESLGIPHAGGLYMLVAQAKRTAELFLNKTIPESENHRICNVLSSRMQNIVLIGMPGSGKSTIAKALGKALSRPVIDADAAIEAAAGKSIPQIFADSGEEGFRKIETETICTLGAASGAIIATGGGVVTRHENYEPLHQNGIIIRLMRDFEKLPTGGRPVSQSKGIVEIARERESMYAAFADYTVDNNGSKAETVSRISEVLETCVY